MKMTNINNDTKRINKIRNEIEKLQNELETLLALKEAKEIIERHSIVTTYEYYMMLVLRNNGIKIFYPEAKAYYDAMEDQWMTFDEKHPKNFNEQEIIDNYKFWLVWRNN
jgi:hypothetical protein